MTLKELRKSKGLSQEQCAQYLDMSTRNYQIYENNNDKIGTYQYNNIIKKLKDYSTRNVSNISNTIYYTHVVTGKDLKLLFNPIKNYQKRDCFKYLKAFIEGDFNGKIGILYGLRRTGKTTLLFQMISELPLNKTAYIKIRIEDNMADLTKDLNILVHKGYKYIFIDEITLLSDFINTAAILSDIFGSMGIKIIVSGTDSLGFAMATRDELYDRAIMIHTSFIPFKEYFRLLNINSIDQYIEYGGTLKKENMNFSDPDSVHDDVSFRDDESTRKYIDSAISRNIEHSLKNDHYGEYFNQLKPLYEAGELTNVINRIVENMNHDFLLSVIQDEFKSHDLGSAKDLLLHDAPRDVAYALNNIDKQTVIAKLKSLIDIKEQQETTVPMTQIHIELVKNYLKMLDLIINCPDWYEQGGQEEHFIFTQPGMRYAIAKALVYSLLKDDYFDSLIEAEKNYIINKILEDVKGRMLEEIVLLETTKALSKENYNVFKFKFKAGGEYDMVVYNKMTNTCNLYEIKHSDKIAPQQRRYLVDEEKLNIMSHRFGGVTNRYVLYRGSNQIVDDIKYLNVEEYLKNI